MANYLIVGAGRGIGLASAQLLSQNHQVYAISRQSTPELAALNLSFLEADTMDSSLDLKGFLPETLDGLVYCPGSITLKPFNRLTDDDFLLDFNQNVLGAIRVIQAALPALRKAKQSSVVLFSTVAVQTGMPYHASIAVAKGGIEALVRSLAAEYVSAGIRFNAIAPSLTDTALASSLLATPEKREALAKRNPMQRLGNPEEMARMTAFLLDRENSWINGQVLALDGGLSSLRV